MAKDQAHTKAKAVSIHVGLNAVDPQHYGGWSGDLRRLRVRRQRHGGDRAMRPA